MRWKQDLKSVLFLVLLYALPGGLVWAGNEAGDITDAEFLSRLEAAYASLQEDVADHQLKPAKDRNAFTGAFDEAAFSFPASTTGARLDSLASIEFDDMPIIYASDGIGGQEEPAQSGKSVAEIAQQTNNPVSDLWMLFMQNDFSIYDGDISDGKRVLNSFKFQPVMPLLLTEEVRMINRPVFQLQSFDVPTPKANGLDWDRETGLGDTVLLQAFSPAQGAGNLVWGVGPTWIFPTATDDSLGGEKWAVGPAAIAMYLGEKWVLGGVVQHWWDYAGDGDRADVNLTDLQYVLRYKVSPLTQLGTGPNIQYNWDTDQLSLPIGLGMDTTKKWGNTVVRYGFDIEYYVHQDDRYGPEWNLRFFFIPIGKAPAWASKPLFR